MSRNQSRRDFLVAGGRRRGSADRGNTRLGAGEDNPRPRVPHRGGPLSCIGGAANLRGAVELTNHAIAARIEALDPRINAVVVRDFERARAAAAQADKALAAGERAGCGSWASP